MPASRLPIILITFPDGRRIALYRRHVGNGKETGVMIDIVQAVTKDAGLKIRIGMIRFEEMISSLSAHKIDLTCAGLLRAPEREGAVSFTHPIYTFGMLFCFRRRLSSLSRS